MSTHGYDPPGNEVSDVEWGRILDRIENGKVIPVIGEQLTRMPADDAAKETSLAEYLGHKLGLPGPVTSLNELAVLYLRRHPRGLDDLYTDIFKELKDESLPIPPALRQLAEIRGFNLFVSTSFDPFMALALNEVRFGRRASGSTRVLAYEGNKAVDLPNRLSEVDYPIVYHLFGRAQSAPLYAVTDEDVLEFVHTLRHSNVNRQTSPPL